MNRIKKGDGYLYTWRAEMPSLSGVLTWETMLSSIWRMVMGTREPHLSQRAVIPHLMAMAPGLFEFGVMIRELAWMMRELLLVCS